MYKTMCRALWLTQAALAEKWPKLLFAYFLLFKLGSGGFV
jgi:hypothetical protein